MNVQKIISFINQDPIYAMMDAFQENIMILNPKHANNVQITVMNAIISTNA